MYSSRNLLKRFLQGDGLSSLSQSVLCRQLSCQKQLSNKLTLVKVLTGFGVTVCGIYSLHNLLGNNVQALCKTCNPGVPVNTLPWYTFSEVQKHNDPKRSVWVVFKKGVYDITEFVQLHPGGEIIMKAAGRSIEPFWALYGVHMQEEVFELLESYRIGNISLEDSKKAAEGIASDPYVLDPVRSPLLKATSMTPFNAEPPPSMLVENFLTPTLKV